MLPKSDGRSRSGHPESATRRGVLGGLALAAAGLVSACNERHPESTTHQAGTMRHPSTACETGSTVAGFAVATDKIHAGGADPTQNRDSSDAIRAAVATGLPVYLPPGKYIYRGPGIDHSAPVIVGAGQGATTVALGSDTIFIDSHQKWSRMELAGIRFDGGIGHVRNRFPDTNVTDFHSVHDCAFVNYSGCSISNNSNDHPYWKIRQNTFHGGNLHSTMAVALSGLTDGTTIADNAFLNNRIHIKLARGGNNTYIEHNDFLRFGPPDGSPRIDIWFTLSPTDTNAGGGMVITKCKFGNENLATDDLRVLYADETAGESIADRWPVLDVASPKWIAGHTISEVFVNYAGDEEPAPLVRSTTSNIVGSRYGPVTIAGTNGASVLSTIEPLLDQGLSNLFGPLLRATSSTAPLPPLVIHD